jgi:hypothetical protein
VARGRHQRRQPIAKHQIEDAGEDREVQEQQSCLERFGQEHLLRRPAQEQRHADGQDSGHQHLVGWIDHAEHHIGARRIDETLRQFLSLPTDIHTAIGAVAEAQAIR